MDPVQSELLNALTRLYQSGKYSDLTVLCNEQQYKVHKALLCSRSKFFDAACSSSFLEANSGEIDLSEENAEVIAHMMDYFYYLDYDMEEDDSATPPSSVSRPSMSRVKGVESSQNLDVDPLLATAGTLSPPISRSSSPNDTHQTQVSRNTARTPKLLSRRQILLRQRPRGNSTSSTHNTPPPLTPSSHTPSFSDEDMDLSDNGSDASEEDDAPTPRLLLHAQIYSAAEKYGMPGLKALAQLKFQKRLFPPTLEAFHASPLGGSEEAREQFLAGEFPDSMQEVYTGTVEGDRGLRNAICQAFRAHPEWGRRKQLAEVIRENGTLGWDLYRMSTGMPLQ